MSHRVWLVDNCFGSLGVRLFLETWMNDFTFKKWWCNSYFLHILFLLVLVRCLWKMFFISSGIIPTVTAQSDGWIQGFFSGMWLNSMHLPGCPMLRYFPQTIWASRMPLMVVKKPTRPLLSMIVQSQVAVHLPNFSTFFSNIISFWWVQGL